MLLSLAMSELMTGAVNIPTQVLAERYNADNFTKSMTMVITADMTTILCAAVTIMTLCSIIIDRYLIICYPMRYVSIVTKRKIVIVIIASWLLPVLVSFLRLIWLGPLLNVSPKDLMNSTLKDDVREIRDNAISGDRYYYIIGFSLYFLIVIFLAVLFVLMFRAIQKLGKDEREFTTEKDDTEAVKREHKAVILFGVMFLAFILCWTPLFILRLLASVFVTHYRKIPLRVLHAIIIVKYLTSIINPVLYILYKFEFNQVFKKDCQRIKKLMCCLKKSKRKRERDGLTEVSFMGHSSTNGHQTVYWSKGNGYMKAGESANV